MKDKLRIGEIRYANCTPIYHTLKGKFDCAGYEFVTGEPAALNAMLAAGGVDVSSSSSVEYARHAGEYLIVPEISISSVGEVGSILLFSKVAMQELGGKDIAVSSASATSTVLLKVLLKKRYGLDARLVPHIPELPGMLEGRQAALLIGDEALKERAGADGTAGLFIYDLGGLWHEFTGLPFVYALWMIREDSSQRLPGLARRFAADIAKARVVAESSFEAIARVSPERIWLGEQGLLDYWRAMSYGLGDAHVKGLSLFFDMAAELNEAPANPALRFL